MNKYRNILLSDLLHHNVVGDDGLNHGIGVMGWMHPPVHRLLGWVTRPSSLRLSRDVWRLNQLHAISPNTIYTKGNPSLSDQATLDRFPTLINADMLNNDGEKIGSIADLVFDSKSGKILHYLVSRSNPKIPGSSRWSLNIDNIKDQQPGMVLTDFLKIEDLPLLKASLRQELMKKTYNLRTQIEDITNIASNKLEGWLEDSPLEDYSQKSYKEDDFNQNTSFENWIDDDFEYQNNNLEKVSSKSDKDPWI